MENPLAATALMLLNCVKNQQVTYSPSMSFVVTAVLGLPGRFYVVSAQRKNYDQYEVETVLQ